MAMSLKDESRAYQILAQVEAAKLAGHEQRATELLAEFDRLVPSAEEKLMERRAKTERDSEVLPTVAGQQAMRGDEGPREHWSGGDDEGGAAEWRSSESWGDYLARTERGAGVEEFRLSDFLRGTIDGASDERARIALEASRETRDMLGGSDTQGGYAIPLGVLGPIQSPLRKKTTVIRAGARTLPVGPNQKWPVQTSDPVVSTHGEGDTVSTTTITLGRIEPPTHAFSAIVKASRELLEDADGIEDLVNQSYSAVAALKIDEIALYGLGASGEPEGISNFDNRAKKDLSSGKLSANGSWDAVLDCRGEILDQDGDEPTSMIMSTREERYFSKLKDGDALPYPLPPALANVSRYSTTQVKTDEGTGSNESRIFLADFTNLSILLRTDVMVTPLRERYADTGEVAWWFWLRFGVMTVHEQHFGTVDSIIPE